MFLKLGKEWPEEPANWTILLYQLYIWYITCQKLVMY